MIESEYRKIHRPQADTSHAPKAWTIKEILDWSTGFLAKTSTASPRLDCEIILAECLGLKRLDLYINFDRPLSVEERTKYKTFLQRRYSGEPVAYIVGEREFYGYSFLVNQHTLIPRPETEHLVMLAKELYLNDASLEILDIGTGSGCLALTLAKQFPNASITAWDIDQNALGVASKNAARLDIATVQFMCVDALNTNNWCVDGAIATADAAGASYDLLVSNPPYVSESERSIMAPETIAYEPQHALFAGSSGLNFYEVFAKYGMQRLKQGGKMILEIGCYQKEAVQNLLVENGWKNVRCYQDYSDLPRVVIAEKL